MTSEKETPISSSPSIPNSQFPTAIIRSSRFSMLHPSPHNNDKKITHPSTSEQPEAKAMEVKTTHFLAISKQDKVIPEMSILTPGGVQEANPDSQPCHDGTAGWNHHVGSSQDSSPDRVQISEEELEGTSEDERGVIYRWRGGENDMLGNGRERLKRHRCEVAGRVWIPEIWGQEELLKDWVDCTVFDSSLVGSKIMSAKAALVEEGRRASSSSHALPIVNRC